MSLWFRWYEGTSEDGKFRVAARNASVTVRDVIALWAFILEDASSDKHRGVCVRNEDFMASVLDFEDGQVEKILESMEDLGMISVGHGAISVCNWGKRQFETDKTDGTNAKRQKEFRDRHRETEANRERNGTVTAAKRPDTDTDTDTEKKDIRAVAKPTRSAIEIAFDQFREVYPKRGGADPKSPAFKVFKTFVAAGVDPQEIIAGARRCSTKEAAKIGTEYIPQAVKWLRDRRWEDYNIDEKPCFVEQSGFYASFSSDEMIAWSNHERLVGKSYPRDKSGGWRFPSQWPPGLDPPKIENREELVA